MIAPSPDWIVHTKNRNLFNVERSRFSFCEDGTLIAYDTGADDGREFTPPLDRRWEILAKP